MKRRLEILLVDHSPELVEEEGHVTCDTLVQMLEREGELLIDSTDGDAPLAVEKLYSHWFSLAAHVLKRMKEMELGPEARKAQKFLRMVLFQVGVDENLKPLVGPSLVVQGQDGDEPTSSAPASPEPQVDAQPTSSD